MSVTRKTKEIDGVSSDALPLDEMLEAAEPVILKGVVRGWPLVRSCSASPGEAMSCLKSYSTGEAMVAYVAPPDAGGKFFYNAEATGMNFETKRMTLDEFFNALLEHAEIDEAPAYYLGSVDVNRFFPGLLNENGLCQGLQSFSVRPVLASLWIGNRTTAAAHFDMTHNLACCCGGRRRFTLFPPDQIANLYPGPLEPTPAGQMVCMADLGSPDVDRFPRIEAALEAAEIAELEPGDVLFYPAMWWHQVEALAGFNVMMNFWWGESPAHMDTPMNTILHGILSLRDRPDPEKRAWRALFDYYVFGDPVTPAAHIPRAARGWLSPLDDRAARRLRALLHNRLNR